MKVSHRGRRYTAKQWGDWQARAYDEIKKNQARYFPDHSGCCLCTLPLVSKGRHFLTFLCADCWCSTWMPAGELGFHPADC